MGGQPLRADRSLADPLGLRQVLRLHRRRNRPVEPQPLRRLDPRPDAAQPGLQLHDRHDRPGHRLDEVREGPHPGQALLHVLRAGRDARAAPRAQGVDRQEQGPVRRRLGQDARSDARAADRDGSRAQGHEARRQAHRHQGLGQAERRRAEALRPPDGGLFGIRRVHRPRDRPAVRGRSATRASSTTR